MELLRIVLIVAMILTGWHGLDELKDGRVSRSIVGFTVAFALLAALLFVPNLRIT